jgi:hypothetical protein
MIEPLRHNLMFCHQYPTGACVTGNGEVRSLRNNVSSLPRVATQLREAVATASIKAVGD